MREAEVALRKTALWAEHVELGARMVSFAGWSMPLQYGGGSLREHVAVRSAVGLFDISHMGRVFVRGEDALPLLEQTTTNWVAHLQEGEAHYNLLCRPDGTTIDDILVYRLSGGFFLVLNASNRERDLAFLCEHSRSKAFFDDATMRTAMLAVQGPRALEAIASVAPEGFQPPHRYHLTQVHLAGGDVFLSRTGYTGEDGVEIIVDNDRAEVTWRALSEAVRKFGGQVCGLGARDTLRMEAGLPLYGHELDDTTTPLEAGLDRFVAFDKGKFLAREALMQERIRGSQRRLWGLRLTSRAVARQGFPVLRHSQPIGVVTSGAFAPTVHMSIAMAYLHPDSTRDDEVQVTIRQEGVTAVVSTLPFYRRQRVRRGKG
ncbi:MAG: glycine cleavage system aminomethyltransferase GcvT [Chloroflexi bacterium]|nr:glycine cleavage system aminomethyltransferase GcvT [Chloroflexota bacterium]